MCETSVSSDLSSSPCPLDEPFVQGFITVAVLQLQTILFCISILLRSASILLNDVYCWNSKLLSKFRATGGRFWTHSLYIIIIIVVAQFPNLPLFFCILPPPLSTAPPVSAFCIDLLSPFCTEIAQYCHINDPSLCQLFFFFLHWTKQRWHNVTPLCDFR